MLMKMVRFFRRCTIIFRSMSWLLFLSGVAAVCFICGIDISGDKLPKKQREYYFGENGIVFDDTPAKYKHKVQALFSVAQNIQRKYNRGNL